MVLHYKSHIPTQPHVHTVLLDAFTFFLFLPFTLMMYQGQFVGHYLTVPELQPVFGCLFWDLSYHFPAEFPAGLIL